MNLYDALEAVANVARISVDPLLEYANEDMLPGRMQGGYSSISITRDEGKLLYALVRHFKPMVAVEVGSHSGCSASHILAAMQKNRKGHLHCIDPGGIVEPGIPDKYKGRYTVHTIDARYFDWPEKVDFVFEDGDHTADLTYNIISRGILHGAKAVLSHDAHNASVGTEVCKGFSQATAGYYRTAEIDSCGLGLAYWIKDGLYAPQ